MRIESSGRLSAGARVTTYHLRDVEYSTVSLRGRLSVLRVDFTDAERIEFAKHLLAGICSVADLIAATASPSPDGSPAAAPVGEREVAGVTR